MMMELFAANAACSTFFREGVITVVLKKHPYAGWVPNKNNIPYNILLN